MVKDFNQIHSTNVQVRHRDHGMYSTSNNVTITGASSGITTTLNGSIAAQTSATTITLASNPGTAFVPSNLQVSSTDQMFIKIDNEIIRGTLSTLTFTSNLRGVAGTTVAAHSSGATIELYQLAEVPLTEINKTHTAIANMMKVDDAITEALRNETPLADAKLEALRTMTLTIVRNRGNVTQEDLDAFYAAGYGEQQVLEIILGLSQKVISNYTNHIAHTPVDEPFKKFEWSK